MKKTSNPNSVESLGCIKCYSWSSPRPIKNLAILLEAIIRRSIVDWEGLKPYLKSGKMPVSD